MFDLNRDWAWQTQAESSQRIAFYNKFMPHVHADFHEMGAESSFFFPPGAKPWHEVITPWQHEFHTLVGKENARLFDQESRLYFTKETFDLFCPSFGDTWPLFNGALGFTYEQGGGGMSGLAYKKELGDILISAYQPQSRLMQVLFEPDSKASDSLSYDLSAWALPYAYNLRAYAIEEQIKPFEGTTEDHPDVKSTMPEKPYGYIISHSDFNVLKFISSLHLKNVRIRQFLKPVKIEEDTYERGSFAITRGDNAVLGEKLDLIVREQAEKMAVKIKPLISGLATGGIDLGSEYTPLIKKPVVAVLGGRDASSSQTGELWYFFEQDLEYPVSVIDAEDFLRADQEKYDVLIVPSGSFTDIKDTIVHFARSGGRVILLERAISIFAAEKSTSLYKSIETRTAEQKAALKQVTSSDTVHLKKFSEANRYSLSERSAGSIYRIAVDTTNPYGFGLGKEWFIMKRSQSYPFLTKGHNVGYILESEPVSGFAGYKFRKEVKNTMVIGSESIGKGEVIYITDDPYFRAFWKSGRTLLWNSVFR